MSLCACLAAAAWYRERTVPQADAPFARFRPRLLIQLSAQRRATATCVRDDKFLLPSAHHIVDVSVSCTTPRWASGRLQIGRGTSAEHSVCSSLYPAPAASRIRRIQPGRDDESGAHEHQQDSLSRQRLSSAFPALLASCTLHLTLAHTVDSRGTPPADRLSIGRVHPLERPHVQLRDDPSST